MCRSDDFKVVQSGVSTPPHVNLILEHEDVTCLIAYGRTHLVDAGRPPTQPSNPCNTNN